MPRKQSKFTTIVTSTCALLVAAAFTQSAIAQPHGGTSACQAPDTNVVLNPESLPTLDSIGPSTSVAAFMQPGVLAQLQVAALRRAWSMDPAIRDFKGLQENDWDFDSAVKIAGFGELGPDFDVRAMVARIISEPPNRLARASRRPIYASVLLVLGSWLSPAKGASPE